METPVRFVRSRDGTRIAYAVEGSGPAPIRLFPIVTSHVQLYPRQPGVGPSLATLSARACSSASTPGAPVCRTGMSVDHSQDSLTDDLEGRILAVL